MAIQAELAIIQASSPETIVEFVEVPAAVGRGAGFGRRPPELGKLD